jgi:hypothetical protein
MFNPLIADEQSHVKSAIESFIGHYGKPTTKNVAEFFGMRVDQVYEIKRELRRAKRERVRHE